MKNFFKNTSLILVLILSIAGFTSCERETIIETEFVDRIVEVPGEIIIVRDTVLVQTEYGNVTFVKMHNDTLHSGENIHLGKVTISDFVGFSIDDIELRFYNRSFQAETFLEENSITFVGAENLGAQYSSQSQQRTELEVYDGIISEPITEFDIYIQLNEFRQNTFVDFDIEIELEKEVTSDLGDTSLDFEFSYDSQDFYNEAIPIIGIADNELVRLYVDDIDVDVDFFNTFSDADIELDLENNESSTILLDKNNFVFEINGFEYTQSTINQAGNFAVSFDFDGNEDQNGNFIMQGNFYENLEINITGPIGSIVLIKHVPITIGSISTNFTFDLEVNM